MNLPTPPTQAPRRSPDLKRGSLVTSSERSLVSDSGDSAAPGHVGNDTAQVGDATVGQHQARALRAHRPTRTSFKCDLP